jgi:hypothetical protein
MALDDKPKQIRTVLDAGVADYLEKGELTSRAYLVRFFEQTKASMTCE